jgi:translation initiation factor 2B subunit (eIF-2B alpha/beta/delta family)
VSGTRKPVLLRTDETPPELSPGAQRLFEQIFSGEFLGASRNIRMINEMFCTMAEEWPTSRPGLVEQLQVAGDFLRRTRGKNTPAIGNAIGVLLAGIDEYRTAPPDGVYAELKSRQTRFDRRSLQNVAAIADYGANLLSAARQVLAFDYSSSVQAILNRLAERGRLLRVVVPESRVIDGGRAFAVESTAAGHRVDYVPDMAFAHFLAGCDAVLIGAETIFASGEALNTIGSYALAVLAAHHHVPYYVASELIKMDTGSYVGLSREIALEDFGALMGREQFPHGDRLDTRAPELERIPAALIRAYIAPCGVILPQHVRAEAQRYFESLGIVVSE